MQSFMDDVISRFDAASHHHLLEQFLTEDLGAGDITTVATVPAERQAQGRLIAKSPLVLAGLEIAVEVFRLLDQSLSVSASFADRSLLEEGCVVGTIRGRAQALLSGERVALNLLQRLSGIATLTRKYVEAVAGIPVKILDTRKTTPGLRAFEKYAVRAGGGHNHRASLSDAILIKENHIRLAGGVRQAVNLARAVRPKARFLEVEVTDRAEFEEALEGSPDIILLDNMAPEEVRNAVKIARRRNGKILLEASGGITLENVRHFAEAGVDWISIGALTHSAPAADLSLEIE
jgi:nicotinate-nucleotide pyrophosphorylase (carboxylating)